MPPKATNKKRPATKKVAPKKPRQNRPATDETASVAVIPEIEVIRDVPARGADLDQRAPRSIYDENGNEIKVWEELFLVTLAQVGTPLLACTQAGVSTSAVYAWRRKDKEFRRKWMVALKDYRDTLLATAAIEATKTGEPDRMLLMFLINRADKVIGDVADARVNHAHVHIPITPEQMRNMSDEELEALAKGGE